MASGNLLGLLGIAVALELGLLAGTLAIMDAAFDVHRVMRGGVWHGHRRPPMTGQGRTTPQSAPLPTPPARADPSGKAGDVVEPPWSLWNSCSDLACVDA